MCMNYGELLADIERYVINTFEINYNPGFTFHNQYHTRRVVTRAKEITGYYLLSDLDSFVVESAAWFHDVGYLSGKPSGHEQRGADMAAQFLENKFVPNDIIAGIRNCILATALPQKPKDLLQQIICDADLYHFGTEEFFGQDKLMCGEVELKTGKKIEKKHWLMDTIQLMKSHQFHTKYCRQLLSKRKELNLNKLIATLELVLNSNPAAIARENRGVVQ